MNDLAAYAREDVVFITPSWNGDLERFGLLRASLDAVGMGSLIHYALVQTEDAALFEKRFPAVRVLPTCDLLDAEVERRRVRFLQATPSPRGQRIKRSLYKRYGWFPDANYFGWHTQQLVKLAVARCLPHRVFVSLDSDVVLTRPVPLSDFVHDGKTALFEERSILAADRTTPDWYGTACQLLDQPWPQRAGDAVANYITHPVCFHAPTLTGLLHWLESRYQRPWWESLLALPMANWSEFMIYGVYARSHAGLKDLFSTPTVATRWLDQPSERADPAKAIATYFADAAVKYLVIQSDHHGRFRLEHYQAPLLAALAQRRGT